MYYIIHDCTKQEVVSYNLADITVFAISTIEKTCLGTLHTVDPEHIKLIACL